MVTREVWLGRIERAWLERSLVWMVGVRRAGKTVLGRSLPDVEYLDCELPTVRRRLEDPESFLAGVRGRRVVLDEVHRLPDPAEVLKIAADHHPGTRVLATGSSSLGASARFRDTLAGRKRQLWLTPVLSCELERFAVPSLDARLVRGGLPPFLLGEGAAEGDFEEWMDSYWARDVQALFRLERRHSFARLVELVLARSGGIFEATWYARACEISRPTVASYLGVLEETFVAHVVRPFSTHRPTEITSAPRVYGFDTGFVCHYRGWERLRPEDRGPLWEHLVLNELHGRLQTRAVRYWRDKTGHEVDFVLAPRGRAPVAVECKWSPGDLDPAGLRAFRRLYPGGENLVVSPGVGTAVERRLGELRVSEVGLEELVARLERSRSV